MPDNPEITAEPTKADAARFVEIFEALNSFEVGQFSIRGYGAFDRSTTPMPDPSVMRVLAWLKDRANGD